MIKKNHIKNHFKQGIGIQKKKNCWITNSLSKLSILQAKNQPNSPFKVVPIWSEKISNPLPTYGALRIKPPNSLGGKRLWCCQYFSRGYVLFLCDILVACICPNYRPLQEGHAIASAHAHTCAKVLTSLINCTHKSNFWLHVFTRKLSVVGQDIINY